MKMYYSIALLCICVSQISASTPLFCAERYTQHYNLGPGCKSRCQERCPTYPPRVCTDECVKGCLCQFGWSRADNGTCIKTESCPSVGCPENSSIQCGCDDSCNSNIRCFRCEYKCFCKPGYSRLNGVCVPRTQCPKL